jgi:hypothetical protein
LIATFTPNFTKLPAAQQRLWPELRPSVELGFVLYGGTAISLQLGHRRSVDFDFFTEEPLDKPALRRSFAWMRSATVLQDAKDTLVVLTSKKSGVKLSFFGALPFGRVGAPRLTDDGVLSVASLEDLLAHKLKVILQRSERKDYEDIAAMLRASGSLAHGLAAAQLFFGRTFQPAESLKALVYFEDGDLAKLSARDRSVLVAAARNQPVLPRVARRSRSLSA